MHYSNYDYNVSILIVDLRDMRQVANKLQQRLSEGYEIISTVGIPPCTVVYTMTKREIKDGV